MDPFTFLAWRFWYFFRDPVRRPPAGRNLVSPADGRVLYRRECAAGTLPNPVKAGVEVPLDDWLGTAAPAGGGTLIGIYMTPLSVHYNRAPIAGEVVAVNSAAAETPEKVNQDPYGAWFFRLKPSDAASLAGLLDAKAYEATIGEE